MNFRKSFSKLLSCCAAIFFAWVASLATAGGQETDGIKFRILTFEKVEGIEKLQLLDPETKTLGTEVKLHKNNFTGPYSSPSRTLIFGLPGSEVETPRMMGQVKVTAALGRNILLIALPTKTGTYQFQALAEPPSRFGKGEMIFFNLTGTDLAGKLNGKNFLFTAGKPTKVGDLSIDDEKAVFPVEFYSKANDKWVPFASSKWLYERDVRNLSFFYKDPKLKNIRIRTITDLPPSEDEDDASDPSSDQSN